METSSPAADWRSDLDAARATLLEVVRDLPQQRLAWRPPAGGSDGPRQPVRDVLWHVGDAEREWQRWAQTVLAGAPFGGFEDHRRPAQYNRLSHLLEWLEETRTVTLELVAGLDADALERRYPAPGSEGGRSLLGMLRTLTEHDREHAEDIARILDQAEAAGV